MPCMGPTRNTELPRRITEILRNDPDALNWMYFSHLNHFEQVVSQALGVKFLGPFGWGEATDAEKEAFKSNSRTIRETAYIMLALLYGKTPETVDWDEFGHALDEVLWEIDCHEF